MLEEEKSVELLMLVSLIRAGPVAFFELSMPTYALYYCGIL